MTALASARSSTARLATRIRIALPKGGRLPEQVWRRRHRGIVILGWLQAVGVTAFALIVGRTLPHSLDGGAVVAGAALVAGWGRGSRRFRAIAATVGLLTASGVLVHLSGGYIEAHFHYFIMVSLLFLYEDWIVFLVALVFVVGQHGIMGILSPHDVYNHAGAWEHPWAWAGVHGAFLLAASAVNLVNWRLNETALAAHQAFLRQVVDANPNPIFVKDWQGRFTFVNQAVADLYGTTVENLLGRTDADFNGRADEVEAFLSDDREVMASGRTKHIPAERVTNVRTGELRWFQTIKVPLESALHEARQVLGVANDITELKRTAEALRTSEERYALAERGANDGLWDWCLRTGAVYFSPRWKSMIGHDDDEVGTDAEEWFGRLHPEDRGHVQAVLAAHIGGGSASCEIQYRIRHKSGSYLWMLARGLAVREADGRATRMAGSQTDITERKLAEERLVHDALHDALTGLPNRALFVERVAGALGRSRRRAGCSFATLFLDLDRFKFVNDSLGHMVGDQLLVMLARRLETCLRPGDTVARLGGDEFTILLEDIHEESDATVVATRIQQELAKPFRLGGQEVFTSASIGIALGTSDYTGPDELLRDADTAMYRAKALGKARHEVFDMAMRARAVALLSLETDLRHALERSEFRLHYQPVVSLETSAVIGFEALLRWQHPEKGLILPGEFIPVAEETGLIVPIGAWVLGEACRQAVDWQAQFRSEAPLTMAVNLSSKQFLQPELVEQVAAILRETGLDPRTLRLEITESAIVESTEHASRMLAALKAMGIQLHIDDFGTGYSSLSYLHRFPIDALKIDRSFIGRVNGAGENLEIIRAIVALARNLGLDIVAEGVETETQLAQMRALECDFGQGFLFSRPLEREAATALLTDGGQSAGKIGSSTRADVAA